MTIDQAYRNLATTIILSAIKDYADIGYPYNKSKTLRLSAANWLRSEEAFSLAEKLGMGNDLYQLCLEVGLLYKILQTPKDNGER